MGVSFDNDLNKYLVTEHGQRGSLNKILHEEKIKLDDEKAFRLAKQIATSLHYLHSKEILHCDLKSQNILLTSNWQVKLCDFGLSRYRKKKEEGQDARGKTGTPHWTAPEILRGEPFEEASDVYSFGVVLWEMLTGKVPFKERSTP
jgi:serine/threonine protein kinase